MSTAAFVAGEVRAAIARKQTTVVALAQEIGMSRQTLHRRLNATEPFNVDELARISRALDVSYESFWPKGDDAA